ncbi:MAG: hypothetical protein KAW56_06975 [Candidatus Marinimicrobia bacterium]|nr:hypothetical protein [Candidatus Neomarinimicrobiota bacterium]MCK4446807.1 hypothetical protein [Candidatus Neomarinimicrobiota bacterium]
MSSDLDYLIDDLNKAVIEEIQHIGEDTSELNCPLCNALKPEKRSLLLLFLVLILGAM